MATSDKKPNVHDGKRHVALKVGGKARSVSSTDDEAENRAKARKGALFLGVVVIIYLLYLVFSGQMGQFVEALTNVDLGWVMLGVVCYVAYFIFGVLAYAIAV